MAKQSGLGHFLVVDGVAISNDVGAIESFSSALETQDQTGLDKGAIERQRLLADAQMEFTSFFNPTGSHLKLSTLPNTDVTCSWLFGNVQGAPAGTIVSKQVNYDPSVGEDKSLLIKVAMTGSDGQPGTWGEMLTAGLSTITGATNTASIDYTSASTGGYLTVHLTAFTGSTITIKAQSSTDNSTFADIDVSAATVLTGIGAVRIPIAKTINVNRYVRANITGTFTSATLVATFAKG